MKVFIVLFAALALALGLPVHQQPEEAPYPGYRLIAISEEKKAWVPFEVLEVLSQSHFNFMDITEHQIVDPSLSRKPSAIPSDPTHPTEVNSLINLIDMNSYSTNLQTLTSFQNRYYSSTGVQSAEWIYQLAITLARNRSDISVSKFTHTWAQPSVILRIEGTSQESNEIVIVGSHQDSTAPGMPTGRSPGADDDGSGSCALLELLRIIVASDYKPENTLELQWYAAEEVGLWGSQAIALAYQQQGVVVRAMMQLDMIGYNVRQSTIAIVTDYTDANVNAFNRKLVDAYLSIGWTNTACGYGCSDHASWNRYGFPSSFPFEATTQNTSPYIHTANDVVQYVSLDHAREFIKLALSFIVELGYEDSK